MSLARQQLLAASGQAPHAMPQPMHMQQPGVMPLAQQLEQLTTDQLYNLIENKEAFSQFMIQRISEAPASKALQDIQSRNRALAQENLNMQDTIEQARNHLAVVKSSEFTAAKGTFSELQARQAAVLETLSPGVVTAALIRDVEQADEASEQLLDKFLTGTLTVDDFVGEYVAQRTAFHALDLKRQVAELSLLGPRQ